MRAPHAMGFCLFNNVALAAKAAQQERGLTRIAIIDFDAHHGNGTQEIFEGDQTVLYASTHQFRSIGTARCASRDGDITLNVPLSANVRDMDFAIVLRRVSAGHPAVSARSC